MTKRDELPASAVDGHALDVCGLCMCEVLADGDQRLLVANLRYYHGLCLGRAFGYLHDGARERWLRDPLSQLVLMAEALRGAGLPLPGE